MPEGDEDVRAPAGAVRRPARAPLQFKYADPMPYELITDVITRLAAVR